MWMTRLGRSGPVLINERHHVQPIMMYQFGQVNFCRLAKKPMSLDLLPPSEFSPMADRTGKGERLKPVERADLHRPIKGSIIWI
jgi:hypothetical protein